MRQGGIFNGMSAIGEIDETMDQIAEEWSREALTPTHSGSGPITDWDSAADRAAIVAADQAILDAQKKAATPASSGGWAGLTDFQKLGIAVAGVLVVGALWKGVGGKSRSYASNPAKRRRVSAKTRIDARTKRYVLKRGPSGKGWTIYDRKAKRGVNWHLYKADSADAAAMYNEYGYRKGHVAKHARRRAK